MNNIENKKLKSKEYSFRITLLFIQEINGDMIMVENYYFTELVVNNEKILAIILPDEISLVSVFLELDIQDSSHFAVELIEKVLNGESYEEEFIGNVTSLKINKDKTIVYDNLAEDPIESNCEIDTEDLLELIEEWENKLQEFMK